MAKRGDPSARPIERETRIERCPSVQTNVRWPAPVDQRLNELLERVAAAGAEATRSQLLAALVSEAPADHSELDELLRIYRLKTAGGIVLQRRGPILLLPRQPGRRPR